MKNLKKRIITIFTIFLLITSGVNFVSAENITEDAVADTNTAQQEKIVSQRNVEEEKESKTDEENKEINGVLNSFNKYFNTTAERLKLSYLNDRVLKNAYISGTSLV